MGKQNRAPQHGSRLFHNRTNHVHPKSSTYYPNLAAPKKELSAEVQARAATHGREKAEIRRLVNQRRIRELDPISSALQSFVNYFEGKIEAGDLSYTSSRLRHFVTAFNQGMDFNQWQSSIPTDRSVRSAATTFFGWVPNFIKTAAASVGNSVLPSSKYGKLVNSLTEKDFNQLRRETRFAVMIKEWRAAITPSSAREEFTLVNKQR